MVLIALSALTILLLLKIRTISRASWTSFTCSMRHITIHPPWTGWFCIRLFWHHGPMLTIISSTNGTLFARSTFNRPFWSMSVLFAFRFWFGVHSLIQETAGQWGHGEITFCHWTERTRSSSCRDLSTSVNEYLTIGVSWTNQSTIVE